MLRRIVFFFNDTATTEIYTLSLHDALPIYEPCGEEVGSALRRSWPYLASLKLLVHLLTNGNYGYFRDRKSTRLNSSHANISYAVFCLKKQIHSCSSHHSLFLFCFVYTIISL